MYDEQVTISKEATVGYLNEILQYLPGQENSQNSW